MAAQLFLCSLSSKRQAILQEDPSLIEDLIDARHEQEIPGYLDLGKAWDPLDALLCGREPSHALADAVLGRSGRPVGEDLAVGKARVLSPGHVKRIAEALEKVPADHLRAKVASDPKRAKEIDFLQGLLGRLCALYRGASERGDAMLVVIF